MPPSVVLTRRDSAARNNQAAITTVIDGKETTITQSGILVTRVSLSRILFLWVEQWDADQLTSLAFPCRSHASRRSRTDKSRP